MSGETQIHIVGNLVDAPELRFTPSGAAVANFTIASTPRTFAKDSGEWRDGEALFLRCSLWRDAAEHAAESLTKGMRVIATGNLKQRSYEKDGQKRTVVELDVEEIGPSLKYATARVEKAQRNGGNGQNSSGNGGGQNSNSRPAQNANSGWGGQDAGGGWGGAATTEPPF